VSRSPRASPRYTPGAVPRIPRLASVACALVGLAAGQTPPGPAPPRAAVVFSGPALDSRYTARVVMSPGDEAGQESVREAIASQLALFDRLLSRGNPTSDISRLNAHRSTEPLAVAASTLEVLALARRVSELTDGAFDITAGPLVDVWGPFPVAADGRGASPAPEALAAARARVGFRLLTLNAARGTAAKTRPDVACDVSALAAGFLADRIAGALAALGHADFLVTLAGEVTARGRRPDGRAWHVAVESPGGGELPPGPVVELQDGAVSSAGDYRLFGTDAQGRTRRLIDPRTGEPVANALASVTVVHRSGAWAEALATGFLALGPEKARAVAAREGLAVRLVERQPGGGFRATNTPALEKLVAP
jgi:thiamine biosynthesis lipoprotein